VAPVAIIITGTATDLIGTAANAGIGIPFPTLSASSSSSATATNTTTATSPPPASLTTTLTQNALVEAQYPNEHSINITHEHVQSNMLGGPDPAPNGIGSASRGSRVFFLGDDGTWPTATTVNLVETLDVILEAGTNTQMLFTAGATFKSGAGTGAGGMPGGWTAIVAAPTLPGATTTFGTTTITTSHTGSPGHAEFTLVATTPITLPASPDTIAWPVTFTTNMSGATPGSTNLTLDSESLTVNYSITFQ